MKLLFCRFARIGLLIFLCSLQIVSASEIVSASVTLHNESIVRTYVGGAVIRGAINVSFASEPGNVVLSSSVPGGTTLLEFLQAAKAKQGIDYNCSISSCTAAYASTNEALTSLSLETDSEEAVGFVVSGKGVVIQALDFMIASEIPASCSRQLSIRTLDDNVSAVSNSNYVMDTSACQARTSGCFAPALEASNYKFVTLSTTNYCNNVTLDPAPAYFFNTSVRASANSSLIVMKLFGSEGESLGSCTASILGTESQKAGCIINYSVTKQEDYFMCVSAKESKNEYEIRFENQGTVCGGAGIGKTTSGDYDLTATPLLYAPLVNVSVAHSFKRSTGNLLSDEADRYIERVYGRDCQTGCVIPFAMSGAAQSLTFENTSILYLAEDNRITDRVLYRVQKRAPMVTSSRPLTLDITGAKFVIPVTAKGGKFTLRIGERNLLGQGIDLNVTPGFDFEIVPLFSLLGVETTFAALTRENISESEWNFGDSSVIIVNGTAARHRYDGGSNYTIRVTLRSATGVSVTRESEILIGDPRESFPRVLNATQAAIGNLTAQITRLPASIQSAVHAQLNTSSWNAQVGAVRNAANNAINESEYANLIQQLLALSLPSSVAVKESGKAPVMLGLEKADADFVQVIANTSVSEEQQATLRENLIDWNRRAYAGEVAFLVVAVVDKQGIVSPLLTHYVVTPVAQTSGQKPVYFVIDRPRETITFLGTSDVRPVTGESIAGTAVRYTGQPIEFYLAEEVPYQELGAHFAPALDILGSYENRVPPEPPQYPVKWVIFWLSLLVVGTLVVYIALQEWYKRHYEHYLFPNSDDLYNVLAFIDNSRTSGIPDDTIHRNLKGSSWNSEQISYAFKKIDGKRTGMLEIPLFRGAERKKMSEEIQKRKQGIGGDARFIKRPSL